MLRLATGNDDDDDNEDGDDENVTYSEETNTVKVPGILWVLAYSSMFRLYEDTMSHHTLDCG